MPYLATPDGRGHVTGRQVRIHVDPRRIVCPGCERSVQRLTVRHGDQFLTCTNLVRDPGARNRRTCGQHLYVMMSPARYIAVVGITAEEFELTSGLTDEAAGLLHDLGILPAAYRALAECRKAS